MEKKDLVEFNKNVEFLGNDIAKYYDEEGNMKILSVGMLFCQVQFLKVTQQAKKVMLFNREISKDITFNKEFTMVPQKDEKDPLKVKDIQMEVELMWKVQNGLGFATIFNNKEEALKVANDMNNKIFSLLEEKEDGKK